MKGKATNVIVYHDVIINYKSYDVIISCLVYVVLTNTELKIVVSIFGIGFQRITVKGKASDVIVYHDVIKVLLRHRQLLSIAAYQC